MTIAYVNKGAIAGTEGLSGVTPALPAGVVAGRLLLALAYKDTTGDIVWPAGWTSIGQVTFGAAYLAEAAYRFADGSDVAPAITWGAGSFTGVAQVFQFSGVTGIGAFSATAATGPGDQGTDHVGSAITSTMDNSTVVYLDGALGNQAFTNPAGWTGLSADIATMASAYAAVSIGNKDIGISGSSSGAIATTGGYAGITFIIELTQDAALQGAADSSVSSTSSASVTGSFSAPADATANAESGAAVVYETFPTISEAIAAASSGAAPTIFFETISESVSAATGASAYSLFILAVNSSAAANGAGAASAIYALSAESVAALMTGTQFVADFTDGWAYNLNTGAASFYEGMAFNSFALIDGEYYGCNAAGIYRLTGDDDAGADIQATITLGTSRLDSDAIKSVPFAYVGAKSAEPMLLTCRVEGQEYIYEFSRETTVMAPAKVKTGKGLEGTYWQFEISNQNGANLDLDHLELITAPKSRKV